MIEFVLKNRKFRLHPDGIMYVRAHWGGSETKTEKWKEVKYCKTKDGYNQISVTLEGVSKNIKHHRIIYYAHNQDWNIFDTSTDNSIDHINRDKTDNRIENLRNVTHQQNGFNTTCKGCSWNKHSGKWVAYIKTNGKARHLGSFKTEEEAHNAYLEAKNTYHIIE